MYQLLAVEPVHTPMPTSCAGQVEEALVHYGENKFDIPLPTFGDMYREQITSPFFVFQIFCVLVCRVLCV